MKKIFVITLILLIFPFVLAQESDVEAGVTQDSIMHGFDRAMERISLMLTLDKANKANKGLLHAQERLMEAQKLVEENKLEKVEKAMEQHEKSIETAKKNLEKVSNGKNEEKTNVAMEKVAKVQNKVENHYEKVTEVKNQILERQRERMSVEQIAHLEEIFNKIKEKAQEMEQNADSKKEKVKEQLKAHGKTQEDVDVAEYEADENSGLNNGRMTRAENEIKKAENALLRARERMNEENADGFNDEIETAKEALEEIKKARDKGEFKKARELAEELKDFGNEVSEVARQLGIAKKEGNFEQVKEQLMQTIQNRHETNMKEVIDKLPVEAQENIKEMQDKEKNENPDTKNPAEETGSQGVGNDKSDEKGKGMLDLEVTDAPADIGDFKSLEVTFSSVRIHSGEGFEERELDTRTVDLTQLIGVSVSVLEIELDVGTYSKIEMFIEEAIGVLDDGEDTVVEVKVPSNKLMIQKNFEIVQGEVTEFVFDINVVKKGNQNEYNLLPVIAKSGVKGKDIEDLPECEQDIDCEIGEECDDGKCKDVDDDYVNEDDDYVNEDA